MTTAKYEVIDFASDDPSTIKNKVANNSLAGQRVTAAYQCYANSAPNMTVKVAAGAQLVNGASVENGIQTSGTITAPVGNPRIDLVVIDLLTGVASIVTGTPAGSPAAPALPAGKWPVAEILLQTSSTAITNSMITDKRVTLGNRSDFSTGDVKASFKAAADAGWVMMNDGTIGNGASGASTRANADTEALYTLLWNNVSNTWCAVSSGRGASAAADFAAGKTLALPKALGRALAVAGAGSGLTSRALGEVLGAETVALATSELPVHSHANTATTTATVDGAAFAVNGAGKGGTNVQQVGAANGTVSMTNANAGSGTAHNNMPPETFLNVMIKL